MVEKSAFGYMPDGTPVERYTLRAGSLSCEVLTYGGTLRTLRVPDRGGRTVDILLGFDSLEDYRKQDKFIGALIGRYANRIAGGRFELNGTAYPLARNDGPNHLHGGVTGFDKQVWTVKSASGNTLVLTLFSPDGQEGYPGDLSVEVTYTLTEEGLSIGYQARSSRDTVCSLTSHAYFNLGGHDSGPVSGQDLHLMADAYTPADAHSIPTGAVSPVAGTPMDFRVSKSIGAEIDSGFPQLVSAGGYDHNWVINGQPGELRPAARAECPATGIVLEVQTTLPGVQFYSGNYLDGCPAGKGGAPYAKHWGFCLETQLFPDTPHHAEFPTCVLHPGELWNHQTRFLFSVA